MYGIFTYIWAIFVVNVGKYSSTMEHMGVIWGVWTEYSFQDLLVNAFKFAINRESLGPIGPFALLSCSI